VGGFQLAAAEAVCGADAPSSDVLEGVSSLIDKSLLLQRDLPNHAESLEPRFTTLETIREYAEERLIQSGEEASSRQRHMEYYLGLAEAIVPHDPHEFAASFLTPKFERLELEHENLRAALKWSIDHGDAEHALRLGVALHWFWFMQGHVTEGRRWLEAGLALTDSHAGSQPTRFTHAHALRCAGWLANEQADPVHTQAYYEASLVLFREIGNKSGIADVLFDLAFRATFTGDFARAETLYGESLALFRDINEQSAVATLTGFMGYLALVRGDFARAAPLLTERLTCNQEQGDIAGVAWALGYLGDLARYTGDLARAADLCEQSLTLRREIGEISGLGVALNSMGRVAIEQGDRVRAVALLRESLLLREERGDKRGVAECLEGLGEAVVMQGQAELAAKLYGAAFALRTLAVTPVLPADQPAYERTLVFAQSSLGEPAFRAAWKRGQTMSLEEVMSLVQQASPTPAEYETQPRHAHGAPLHGALADLTGREIEVLQLLAQGLSYREIADRLVISPRTVNRHLTSIYGKLHVDSRHAAARVAIDHGLV
jgi:ATP/maltotriose-dependent transcriptional regulator MalT